jgi:hypothetical protein
LRVIVVSLKLKSRLLTNILDPLHNKDSVLLTKYDSGEQIEKNEMGGACSTHGERRVACRVLVWKPEGKRPLGRHKLRWEDNIKMDLKEVGWGHGLD